ncbi:c-type cytochrome [Fulvivirgaceae bacterium BMA12]|uniref:C-type cytochrome n=1 Tax=Agaribacillus aureus TaxID=3051825 RepID=A0ABT8L065_9BACT|nr:c-type cytochrome [Fulvivirgaceae bacterium BMA12]
MVKKFINDRITRLLQIKALKLSFTLILSVLYFQPAFSQESSPGDIPSDEASIAAGKATFQELCTVCHAVDKRVVGPALMNVYERRDLPWIISFVKNSQKVISSGDPYAVALYNEYNKTQMSNFDYLSDEEIINIVAYIKHETDNPATPQAAASEDAAAGGAEAVEQGGIPSQYLTAILAGLLVILVIILGVLMLIISVLTKYLKDKKDLDEESQELVAQKLDFGKFFTSSGFLGLMIFLFAAVAFKSVIDGLYTVGVQQNYEPTQPIAFSHALHAGEYEIDCNYCHTGVMKSKNANIPSANICMNCHGQILTESPEIAKIYKALDYDKRTQTYGPNQKPIEWVRIHNLPDLAYFNHSQHVKVGGIECQTCHGEIQEMTVVKQHANLTMGWCIDCHRQTDVNTVGNKYYDQLVELHEASNKNQLKVKDIGGLECSKCHY